MMSRLTVFAYQQPASTVRRVNGFSRLGKQVGGCTVFFRTGSWYENWVTGDLNLDTLMRYNIITWKRAARETSPKHRANPSKSTAQ
jgi:hypothetical protein